MAGKVQPTSFPCVIPSPTQELVTVKVSHWQRQSCRIALETLSLHTLAADSVGQLRVRKALCLSAPRFQKGKGDCGSSETSKTVPSGFPEPSHTVAPNNATSRFYSRGATAVLPCPTTTPSHPHKCQGPDETTTKTPQPPYVS